MKYFKLVVLFCFISTQVIAAQTTWNNGDSGSTVRAAIQANDTELYSFKDGIDTKASGVPGVVKLYTAQELLETGAGFVGPDNVSDNTLYKLPSTDPTVGQIWTFSVPVTTTIDGDSYEVVTISWSDGAGSGDFAFDTYPTYEDSAHDTGIAVNSTTLAIYSADAAKWLTVGLTDTLDPAPTTYSLTLAVVSDGTITIDSTDYTSSGSPYTITGLLGATTMTASYGGSNDDFNFSGADSGDVTGSYDTYSITMDDDKSLTGTFSASGGTAATVLDVTFEGATDSARLKNLVDNSDPTTADGAMTTTSPYAGTYAYDLGSGLNSLVYSVSNIDIADLHVAIAYKTPAFAAYNYIFCLYVDDNNRLYINNQSSDSVYLNMYIGGVQTTLVGTTSTNDGSWHVIEFTISGTAASLMIDSNTDDTDTLSGTWAGGTTASVYYGVKETGASYSDCVLDALIISEN